MRRRLQGGKGGRIYFRMFKDTPFLSNKEKDIYQTRKEATKEAEILRKTTNARVIKEKKGYRIWIK